MNINKWGKALVAALTLVAGLSMLNLVKEKGMERTIAVTQFVEHPALDATYKGMMDELEAEGFYAGKNYRLIYELAQGDAVIAAQIAQKFVGMKPDVIVAIPTTSAQTVRQATMGSGVPVVFSSVTDPVGAKLVGNLKMPEGNVTGQSNFLEVKPQLEKFREILPGLKRLGVIYNPSEANSVVLVEMIRKAAGELGMTMVVGIATSSSEVSQAAKQLVGKVDAIYIANDNTALSAFEAIVNVGNANKLPVFVSDTDMVIRGAVAALGPNQYDLGRETGKMVVKVLRGAKISSLPVGFPKKVEFVVNLKAARAVGIVIPEKIVASADFVIREKD